MVLEELLLFLHKTCFTIFQIVSTLPVRHGLYYQFQFFSPSMLLITTLSCIELWKIIASKLVTLCGRASPSRKYQWPMCPLYGLLHRQGIPRHQQLQWSLNKAQCNLKSSYVLQDHQKLLIFFWPHQLVWLAGLKILNILMGYHYMYCNCSLLLKKLVASRKS